MATGGRGPTGGVGGGVATTGAGGKPAAGTGGAGGSGYEEYPTYVCGTIQAEPPGVDGQAPAAAGRGGASGGTAGRGAAGAGGARAGAGGAAAGGSSAGSGGGAAGGGAAATYAQVHELLKCEGCDSSFCHGNAAGFNIGALGRTEFYELLVGKDGKGGPSGTMAEGGSCAGMMRVVPGDPEKSLLYLKLANRASCGDPGMPIMGAARMEAGLFNARQLEVVRSWIAAGAKKDGM